jgi:hypothetical protein
LAEGGAKHRVRLPGVACNFTTLPAVAVDLHLGLCVLWAGPACRLKNVSLDFPEYLHLKVTTTFTQMLRLKVAVIAETCSRVSAYCDVNIYT